MAEQREPEGAADPQWMRGTLRVVVNHEDQHSIWPVDRELPPGWTEVGVRGSKAECLAYIETAWTDMRPRSIRG
jgi:MbtH protein